MKYWFFFLTTSLFATYASFDFLWWESIEKGLEYASKNAGSTFDQNVQIYEPNFGFHPAFRLKLGTHLPEWDIEFDYTHYTANALNKAQQGIRAVWTSGNAFEQNIFDALWGSATSKWDLQTNLFGLYLKAPFDLTCAIIMEPTFGLKMALLQQRYKVDYQEGNLPFIRSTIAMKNRSFNIGPTTALLTRWNVWRHLDLLANLSGALFASRFTVGRHETDISSIQTETTLANNTYWLLRPQAGITLGLGWSLPCYGFAASYEAQIFWKQNMLYRFIDQTNAAMITPTQGDLFFHGLTIDAYINF